MTARRRRIFFCFLFFLNRFVCDSTLACELFFFFEISLPLHFLFLSRLRARGGRLYAQLAFSDTDNRERNGVSLVSLLSFF